MKKIKLLMFGLLSVLTLGLFVVTGTDVNAAEVSGTDYWELYRGDSTVNTNNYFTLSELAEKSQTVTNTNGYKKHDGTDLANLNKNWQIASGDTKKISFTTGDNANGYTLEILMIGNKDNSTVKLNGTSLDAVGTTNLEKVSASLSKSTTYNITKGTNSNYIHYICVYKAIVSSNSYTLNYNANGHGNAPTSVSEVNALTSTLLNETINGVEGYRFDGWYMESTCTTKATTSTSLDDYASNGVVTLYANWVQTKTISFYDPEDTENAIKTETYDYATSINYVPTKENCSFAGWYSDSTLTTALSSTVVGESTPTSLFAKFTDLSYSGNPNALTSDYLAANYVPTTAVTVKTNLTGLNYYLTPDLVKQTIKIDNQDTNVIYLGGTGSPSIKRSLGFNSPAKGVLKVKVYATGNRQWGIYDLSAGEDILVTDTLAQEEIHEIQVSVESNKSYEIYCKNNKCYIVSAEFIQESVTVMQQEAPSASGTTKYIRFIAVVKGVVDIEASDFIFKVYSKKGEVTKSITRSVKTCSEIQLSGATYSAPLPGETTNHSFDGANGTEFYAVYVIELTNATFAGCTINAGFAYNGGTEQKTNGYTFAA